MSEFCKPCARELYMKADPYPLFCEHCKKYKYSFWQRVVKWIKK